MWNVILSRVENNVIKQSENNPTKSGRYVCTCVICREKKEYHRYLQMMEYDAKSSHWHDIGNNNAISHLILAWTDCIEVCDFMDFEYHSGGYLTKKGE